MQHVGPRLNALGNLVELSLDLAGVADLDKLVLKPFFQELGDGLPKRAGVEAAILLVHIATIFDDVDDAGVGGGAADSFLFEFLDERGFAEPWRRRLKFLTRLDVEGCQLGALLKVGQHLIAVVFRYAVDRIETVEPQHAAAGLEDGACVLIRPAQTHGGGVPLGISGLARHKALVDQAVELELLVGERGGDLVGLPEGIGGANGFVGLLGAAVAAAVGAGLFRHVLGAKPLVEVASRHFDRVRREVGGVGSHVCDETDAALVGQVDALVELLCDSHRAVGRHAQSAAGRLLQCAGDERRVGPRAGPCDVDRLDGVAGLWVGPTDHPDGIFAASFAGGIDFANNRCIQETGGFGGLLCGNGELHGGCLVGLDAQRLACDLDHVAGKGATVCQPCHPFPNQWRPAAFVATRHKLRPVRGIG